MEFPLDGYDAYHASPPCQAYVDHNKNKESKHPKLIEPIRIRLQDTCKPFVIENVVGFPFLMASLMLCGTMFNLRVFRHRYFETSFPGPMSPYSCNHWGKASTGEFIGVYAFGAHGPTQKDGYRGKPLPPQVTPEKAMNIDWMTKYELTQAIPPDYTKYIGEYLLKAIKEAL